MRIIAGRWRGRRLAAPEGQAVRPTSDRAREALFNILEHGEPPLHGARFLDLFAGTGAIGIEAASRGAATVLMIERAGSALAAIRANLAALGEPPELVLRAGDALRLGRAPHAFDMVVMDPPYGEGAAAPALASLVAGGWLAPSNRVVVETRRGEAVTLPAGLIEEGARHYGRARLLFLRFEPAVG